MSDDKELEDAVKPTEDADKPAEKTDDKTDESAMPEAIARRVAALGEEDPDDIKAREEERKLAERRAATRKGKKKTGLEAAASKKLSKIGTRAEPKRTIAVASDADPLIERTAKLSDWAKKNQRTVQIVGALITAALLGVAAFMYYDHKHEIDASVMLAKAVADERARIGEPPKDDEESDGSPVFKTYDERREAALKKYRDVQLQFPKTGASILSRLAEGSLLLDKHEPDAAIAAYNDVKGTALAANDQEVKGRILEGLGFAYEMKADKSEGDKAKNLDEAAKLYKELESTVDVKGFKELAMYHQARIAMAKGDKDKAKELLLSIRDRLQKPDDNPVVGAPGGPAFPYLSEVAMDRLRELDPAAAPKTPAGGAPNGNPQLNPAQLKKMMEEMQKKGAGGGGGH